VVKLNIKFDIEIDDDKIINTIRKYGKATIIIAQEKSNTITIVLEETGQIIGYAELVFL